MNKIKAIVSILLWLAIALKLSATTVIPDTVKLEEVTISANRLINFTTGSKIQDLEPLLSGSYKTENLSSILSQTSQVSVKSYGLRGLSNVSMRGMGSKHTAILWNGFNIQNSMNLPPWELLLQI